MSLIFALLMTQAEAPPKSDEATALAETTAYVRMQGFPCRHPKEAAPDAAASRPNERSWILTCESGRYRVTFTGDTGAVVQPLTRP